MSKIYVHELKPDSVVGFIDSEFTEFWKNCNDLQWYVDPDDLFLYPHVECPQCQGAGFDVWTNCNHIGKNCPCDEHFADCEFCKDTLSGEIASGRLYLDVEPYDPNSEECIKYFDDTGENTIQQVEDDIQ